MHVGSYIASLSKDSRVQIIGFWEDDPALAKQFCSTSKTNQFAEIDELLDKVDAVIVCAPNADHHDLVIKAAKAKKSILCEKPIATSEKDGEEMVSACKDAGVIFMTGFPCRFSPSFKKLKERIKSGEIGQILALNSTNRGTCPFGWFVDIAKSGGGAMIDHVVHVADLLHNLLGEEPHKVTAVTGNQMYKKDWEDSAVLILEYPSGIFASLDSSWSRPKGFKTWGDVTMRVIGEKGVISLNMFGQDLGVYQANSPFHVANFGSNLDEAMVSEFIAAIIEKRQPSVTGADGLAALRVALKGYESLNLNPKIMR